jgi:MFS family permease
LTPRRHLLAASVVLLLVGCWPWYVAAAERSVPLIVLLVLAAAGASFASGVFGAVVADLFPTRLRYSGVASAYNVSFTAFSGTAPLLATVAISATGAVPALVMVGCAALALFGSLWIGSTAGKLKSPAFRRRPNRDDAGLWTPLSASAILRYVAW